MPPEPMPSDLQSPVPGNVPNPFQDILGDIPKPNIPKTNAAAPEAPDAAAPAPSAGGNPFGDIFQKGQGEINPDLPSAGNRPGGLGGDVLSLQNNNLSDAAKVTAQNLKELGTNFLANLHQDPQAALQTFKNSFGDGNAKLGPDKKTIYFRAPGEKDFRPASKGLFDGMANFISEHSRATLFGAGALATQGLLGAVGLVPEAAEGAAAGAESLSSKLASHFTKEALGTAAATGAGGEITADQAGNAASNLTNDPNAPSLGQSAMEIPGQAMSGAAAGLGAQATVGPAFELLGSGTNAVSEGLKNALQGRWQDVKNIYSDLQTVFKEAGMQLPESSYSLGKQLFGVKYPKLEGEISGAPMQRGAVDQIRKDLSDHIDAYTSAAEKAAGDQKYSLGSAVQNMREQMQKQGIQFQEKTVHVPESAMASKIPPELNFDDLENYGGDLPDHRAVTAEFAQRQPAQPISKGKMTSYSIDPETGEKVAIKTPGYIGTPQSAAWGEKSVSNVNDVMDLYNTMLLKEETGGFSPLEATNFKRKMQAIFDPKNENAVGSELASFLKGASHDVTLGQKDILQEVLGGSSEVRDGIDQAYKNYSSRADLLDNLTDTFHRSGAAEKVADDLVKNQGVDDVRGLKLLLDNDKYGKVWSQVKGNWFDNLVSGSSDENILNPKALSKKLFQDTPEEIRNMMFTPEQQNALKLSLTKLSDIPFSTYVKNADQEEALLHAFNPLLNIGPGGRLLRSAKSIFGLLGKNGPVADYMAGPGFLRLAEQASDVQTKSQILGMGQQFKQFLSESKKVYNEKFGYNYQVPIGAPFFSKSFEAAKSKTLGDVYGEPRKKSSH